MTETTETETYFCRPRGTSPGDDAERSVTASDMHAAAAAYARTLVRGGHAGAVLVQGDPPRSSLWAVYTQRRGATAGSCGAEFHVRVA